MAHYPSPHRAFINDLVDYKTSPRLPRSCQAITTEQELPATTAPGCCLALIGD